jgi:antitoxin HigA-1
LWPGHWALPWRLILVGADPDQPVRQEELLGIHRIPYNIQRKPVHPGEMLRDAFLLPLQISANRLASELRVPVTRITEILNERRTVTADTALRLERYFGMSADFWLALQKDYDLQTARQAFGKQIMRDVKPRRKAA